MGLFGGQLETLLQQTILIVSAFAGAQLGYSIISAMVNGGRP